MLAPPQILAGRGLVARVRAAQAVCPSAPRACSQRRISSRAQASVENQGMTEEERISVARMEVTKRIKALGAAGRVKDAISALAGLADMGIQPDTRAATALVQACTRDMELAQSIFEEMFGEFLAPDEVSFAVLLRGYGARSPPDWRAIDATLTSMRVKYGIEPTSVSFNVLLDVCCRTNDLERGQDIIDRMAADGVDPDEFTEEVVAKRKSLRSYLRKTLL